MSTNSGPGYVKQPEHRIEARPAAVLVIRELLAFYRDKVDSIDVT